MSSISVSLRNLHKRYSGANAEAVEDFSLEVSDSEFIVLVGHSGCGKSTVLRMIAGLETPTDGEVWIGDQLCNALEPKDRDIAMVFQNYALYPHMTVRGNMEFGLKLSRRLTHKEVDTRVQEAADILGITPLLDRKPPQLSGGERQRVALGRAIVRKPKVFLFDEPLSNLDANMRSQMRVELGRLHARLQTTMIYVTHDQVEAMTMGDRIVCMQNGHIRQVGSPLELYHKPASDYVGAFIGTPPMNFINLERQGEVWRIKGGANSFHFPNRESMLVDGFSAIRLGIRPEHIALHGEGEGLEAQVEVVETLGFETLVYLGCAGSSLVVRLQGDKVPEVGEHLRVFPHQDHLHCFDSATGMRLVQP